MEQNQLTRDLYAAGYTREDHPSFVYWSDWQNFGYLFEALLKFTWETPCGLLVDGKSDLGRGLACCDASFQGIDYCPENDNPLLRCPHERKDCPQAARMVRYAVAVLLQQLQKSLFVKIILGL